jgi:tRNA pseudouridine38-40 synthase
VLSGPALSEPRAGTSIRQFRTLLGPWNDRKWRMDQRSRPGDMSDLVRLRLDISYDGTDFSGWAVQPNLRTVAGELTDALQVLLRQPVRLVVAGRTDSGVHATGQVAHVDVSVEALRALAPRRADVRAPVDLKTLATETPDSQQPDDDFATGRTGLLRRLAGVLPLDVRVRRVSPAPAGFDARFSALRRHYRYRIGTGEWGVEPADRRFVLARRRTLDAEAMSLAAAALVGLRDFAAFCRPREGATTIRELQALTVRQTGDEVHIDVTADAFCHSMVRALVGSLMTVGELRVPIGRPAALQAAGQRSSEIHVAPAHGLTLLAVDYPPDSEFAGRAETARARRNIL